MRNKVRFLTEAGKRRMLSKYGIIYDKTTRNVVRVHNKNESWGHFLTKAVLYKLFRDRGYDVLLEAETVHGVIDVYIVDLHLAIEVVSAPHPKKVENKKKRYSRFTDILIVTVPEIDTDGFCQNIEKQVHIWL
jgi:hypothetical protein